MSSITLYFYILVTIAGFALSLILTPLVKKIAIKTGQVALPKDNRWHRTETALLGGVSIFVSTVFVWVSASLVGDWAIYGKPFLPMMLCASAIFLLGLTDDVFNMDPQHKLAGQIVITAILMFFGYRLGWTDSSMVNLFLTIFWIVGITNAFNLLDNMDGLSAGIALIAATFLFIFHNLHATTSTLSVPMLLLLSAYLGSILGFLIHNFNPASIFMGDAGSLFIGFVLACLSVAGSPSQIQGGGFVHLASVISIPILILLIPILDTGFVSLMRKLFRKPISQGGKDHSSHRLVAIGFSEKKAVIVLYAFAIASGVMALLISYLSMGISIVVIILYLLFIVFFWVYLAKVKVYREESVVSSNSAGVITPVLIEITYRRRLFEVFLDFILIAVAYYTAYLLRFEGVLGEDFNFFLKSLPIIIACQTLCMYFFGVYRGVWESVSLSDLVVYIKAITSGTVLTILIILFIYRFHSFSRAVFVIYWFFLLILVSLSRLSFRIIDEGIKRGDQRGKNTIIYGAGIGGQMALREIETNNDLGLRLIGFLDDNRNLHRRKVKGYPVLGGQKELEGIIRNSNVQAIVVSFKKDGAEKKKELKNLCIGMGVEVDIKLMKLIIN